MWVPEGEDWLGGLCDRLLVVSRENILDSLDIMPQLITKPFVYNPYAMANPELFYRHTYNEKKLKVKRMRRVMITVAPADDSTRWSEGKGDVPGFPGMSLKYPGEYKFAKLRCEEFDRLGWGVEELREACAVGVHYYNPEGVRHFDVRNHIMSNPTN